MRECPLEIVADPSWYKCSEMQSLDNLKNDRIRLFNSLPV